MDDGPPRVALVFDGTDGRGRAVAEEVADRAARRGGPGTDLLDLAEAGLPEAVRGHPGPVPCAVADLGPWLADADAFVVVAVGDGPPAGLRDAVGWCADTWRDKPIALVVLGTPADALRVGSLLRSLPTGPVVATASLRTDPGTDRSRQDAADRLLDHLLRWTHPLRRTRTQ
ncbi:NADPH-dependent FMN reductase [Nocardiopsis sp. CC223A]|uniref:NADPH-dependent FMN reductase n=1 Tax=Nocardiopsis sp. CC223A TaxID=3044051 RepID=UPI00278C3BAB|nr:NAD(P)H-dependent oxidoreductase [Nocardiopsis sp. CC223A]